MPDYGLPMSDEPHRFGGRWTEEKLEILTRYLKAYTTALQSKPSPERPFVKAYIDAFAGSGHILARKQRRAPASLLPEEDDARDEHAFLEGSAQRALAVEPRFDRYIFIEKKGRHRASLERVRREAGNSRAASKSGAATRTRRSAASAAATGGLAGPYSFSTRTECKSNGGRSRLLRPLGRSTSGCCSRTESGRDAC